MRLERDLFAVYQQGLTSPPRTNLVFFLFLACVVVDRCDASSKTTKKKKKNYNFAPNWFSSFRQAVKYTELRPLDRGAVRVVYVPSTRVA